MKLHVDEFLRRFLLHLLPRGFDALAVAVRRVSPAEGHLPVSECEEPAVGDADVMGVCTEVAEHMFRSAKGWLGVDDPVVTIETSEPCSEAARLG